MYSVRIFTTADASLPPPNFGPNLTWDRLTEALRRELGPEAAGLLAEPIPDAERAETHWHVEAASDPVPISALPAKDREIVLERLAELRARIRGYASRLEKAGGDENARLASAFRSAILVPDDTAYVWSLDGNPILAGWGRRSEALERSSHVITRQTAAPRPTAARAGVFPGQAVEKDIARQSGRRAGTAWLLPFLLWLLFIGTALFTGYLLLPACAVDLPLVRTFFDTCRGPAVDRLVALREQNSSLRRAIESAETKVALSRPPCPADNAIKKTERPTPHDKETTATQPTGEETKSRAEEAGGKHGKLDITLSWNGHADLDLHVQCPGGRLSYKDQERHSCEGGEFEIDRNAGAELVDNPVEHVSWAGDPPAGDYRVDVQLYDYHDAPEGPVPFTVVITEGGASRTYSGTVGTKGASVKVTEFRR
ncbi:MAG TPA: hypothetical protein VNR65_00855 [Geobacterales bacterium]|nr:hypothetical protein [Geobacterales bacterium]